MIFKLVSHMTDRQMNFRDAAFPKLLQEDFDYWPTLNSYQALGDIVGQGL